MSHESLLAMTQIDANAPSRNDCELRQRVFSVFVESINHQKSKSYVTTKEERTLSVYLFGCKEKIVNFAHINVELTTHSNVSELCIAEFTT